MIDWQACALAAKRANSAYIEDESAVKTAFATLGDLYVSRYQDGSHQVVLSVDGEGKPWVSIAGTRFSDGKILDVLADVSLDPVDVGGNVTKGAYTGMQGVWDWALSVIPEGVPVNVCGHSLGAARTHLTPLFLPAERIGDLYSFEAPKFCDNTYYVKYAEPLSKMVCVLNGADLWAGWPWFDSRWGRPLNPHVWLTNGWYSVISADQWPGGKSNEDHSIDAVQAKVEAISTNPILKGFAASVDV